MLCSSHLMKEKQEQNRRVRQHTGRMGSVTVSFRRNGVERQNSSLMFVRGPHIMSAKLPNRIFFFAFLLASSKEFRKSNLN